MEQPQRGRILRVRGHPLSGILMLDLQELDSEEIASIPCEAAATMRALHDAFISQEKNPVGEVIYYELDDNGFLAGFTPGALMEKVARKEGRVPNGPGEGERARAH